MSVEKQLQIRHRRKEQFGSCSHFASISCQEKRISETDDKLE